MNRYAKDRTDQRFGPKIQKLTLSKEHLGLRFFLVLLLILAGAWHLAKTAVQWLGNSSGWQEITVTTNTQVNCSSDFRLVYDVGSEGMAAGPQKRVIADIYTEACIKGYQLFTIDETIEGMNNLCSINQNPGEILEVDPVLYLALKEMEACDSRLLFLAPVYAIMENLCTAETDGEAKTMDPVYDASVEADVQKIMTFVNDPKQIRLEFPGENQVCLYVSEAYRAFAADDGISTFLDFYQLKNAFLIDYIADCLLEAGYTRAMISSYDGYSRSLSELSCTFDWYEREGNTVRQGDSITVPGPSATVILRDFPLEEKDRYRYYVYDDGEVRTPFLSPEDGACRNALSVLAASADSKGCSEIALELYPVYVSEEVAEEDLCEMTDLRIYRSGEERAGEE